MIGFRILKIIAWNSTNADSKLALQILAIYFPSFWHEKRHFLSFWKKSIENFSIKAFQTVHFRNFQTSISVLDWNDQHTQFQ